MCRRSFHIIITVMTRSRPPVLFMAITVSYVGLRDGQASLLSGATQQHS